MNQRVHAPRCVRAILGCMGLLVASGACDWMIGTDSDFADEARVTVTGQTPVTLLLVTSTAYIGLRDEATGDVELSLLQADTAYVSDLPYEQLYTLRGQDRFLVRLINPDSSATATIHLEIHLDGRRVYTQAASISDGSLEYATAFGR